MPNRIPEPDYPAGVLIRKVRSNGQIRLAGNFIHLSCALAGEAVALEPIETGWRVWFYREPIALIDAATPESVTHPSGLNCYPSYPLDPRGCVDPVGLSATVSRVSRPLAVPERLRRDSPTRRTPSEAADSDLPIQELRRLR